MRRISDHENSFAHNKDKERIHISEAVSGRRGYYCIGCKNEMQAVKSKLPNRISYFRHHALDVTRKKKCTYSDVAERFKVAGEILTQLKQLKVPAVYKHPTDNLDGMPYKISGAKTITAFQIARNIYFYEDKEHQLLMGGKKDSEELTLLAKGDVVFLDQREEPILIIQFVERHKMTDDAKVKLHTLGIDTVQITIPRESPESIALIFQTTEKVKWLYNNDHATTEYVRVPFPNSEGLPVSDELQRQFFEENFFCRRAQIARVIRAINRCLESKSYREIEDGFRSAIQRVEQDRRAIEDQLREFQAASQREAEIEFEHEERRIEERRERLRDKSKKIRGLAIKVKERFERQKSELEQEEREVDSRIDEACRNDGVGGSSVDSRKRKIEEELGRIEESIEAEKASIVELDRKREALSDEFRKKEEQIERATRKLATAIENGDISSDEELSRRTAEIMDFRRTLNNYIENYPTFVRYNKAWKCFNTGAYKNWANQGTILGTNGTI